MNGKVAMSRNMVFDEEASRNWNKNGEVAVENHIPLDFETPTEANNGVPAVTFSSIHYQQTAHTTALLHN